MKYIVVGNVIDRCPSTDYDSNEIMFITNTEYEAREFIYLAESGKCDTESTGAENLWIVTYNGDKDVRQLYYISEYDAYGQMENEYISDTKLPPGFSTLENKYNIPPGYDTHEICGDINDVSIQNGDIYASTKKCIPKFDNLAGFAETKIGCALVVKGYKCDVTADQLRDRDFIMSVLDQKEKFNIIEIESDMDGKWIEFNDDLTEYRITYDSVLKSELSSLPDSASKSDIIVLFDKVSEIINSHMDDWNIWSSY